MMLGDRARWKLPTRDPFSASAKPKRPQNHGRRAGRRRHGGFRFVGLTWLLSMEGYRANLCSISSTCIGLQAFLPGLTLERVTRRHFEKATCKGPECRITPDFQYPARQAPADAIERISSSTRDRFRPRGRRSGRKKDRCPWGDFQAAPNSVVPARKTRPASPALLVEP